MWAEGGGLPRRGPGLEQHGDRGGGSAVGGVHQRGHAAPVAEGDARPRPQQHRRPGNGGTQASCLLKSEFLVFGLVFAFFFGLEYRVISQLFVIM